MKALKKNINQYRSVKISTISNVKILQGLITKYEDLNLKNYTEGDEDAYVFNNPHSPIPVKDQMDHMADNLKNPFEDMYYWCKAEIYDLQALQETVNQRDNIEKMLKKQESKKKDVQADLDNVTAGKKSVRTIFKNQNDAGGLVNSLENVVILYNRYRRRKKLITYNNLLT